MLIEGLKDVEGSKPDILLAYADTKEEASAAIASHTPNSPRVQKKTTIRIQMLNTLEDLKVTKLVGEPARIVRTSGRKRRRRRRHAE